MRSALAGVAEVAAGSVKAKNAALFWVYMVEWAVVTGTAVVVGFIS